MLESKKSHSFFKKKRGLLLNISFISLWVCFFIGYKAGLGGSDAFAGAALALFVLAALLAVLARK